MTNTENVNPTPADDDSIFDELASAAELDVQGPGYTETVAAMDGHFDQPEMAYRVLAWFERKSRGHTVRISAHGFSTERQESLTDLIRNGLIRERFYGSHRRLKLTDLGRERLQAAWSAANLVTLG